jgi:hypothetical protein
MADHNTTRLKDHDLGVFAFAPVYGRCRPYAPPIKFSVVPQGLELVPDRPPYLAATATMEST